MSNILNSNSNQSQISLNPTNSFYKNIHNNQISWNFIRSLNCFTRQLNDLPQLPVKPPLYSHFRIQLNHLSKRKSTLFTVGKCPDEKAVVDAEYFRFDWSEKEMKKGGRKYHHHCFFVILFLCSVLCRSKASLFVLLIKEARQNLLLLFSFVSPSEKKGLKFIILKHKSIISFSVFFDLTERRSEAEDERGSNFPITQTQKGWKE